MMDNTSERAGAVSAYQYRAGLDPGRPVADRTYS